MTDMSRQALEVDLCASLGDSANKLDELDWGRLLDTAARDLSRFRRRTKAGTLSLKVGVAAYAAPASLVGYKGHHWGDAVRRERKPWDNHYPGPPPRVHVVEGEDGLELHLTPAPFASDIIACGSSFPYFYYAEHSIGETASATTVRPADRGLLLLRAQAEAMLDLSLHHAGKPVALRDGFSGVPKNGMPAALYEQLMQQFERQAAR